ncbi:MAG: DUF4249 domain-containing protein [Bacteroidota bacterium]|nr:DUF4249 domain-containing protein [Bacteroidota bacterium]
MKKNRTILFLIVTVSVFFSSCQQVIQLDLDTSVPHLVIQGNVYDQAGPYKVKISKTVNFDAANIYPAVTNATVTISDNAGLSEVLSQDTAGTYITSKLHGKVGRTYILTVNVDGKTYTASSTMPVPAEIDSIYYKNSLFGGSQLIALDFINPPNKENYYRIIHFINDKQATGFSIFSKNTSQAEKTSYAFMSTNPRDTTTTPKLKKGDKVAVWLECIDKGVFEYFRTANSEGGQNASPANPVSNISNGALGYFSACSVRKRQIVFQ